MYKKTSVKEVKGTIIRSTGSWYSVKTVAGTIINCRLRGKFRTGEIKTTNPVAVGDVVYCYIAENSDTGSIISIEERKNCIIRKATKTSKQKHIIAANIDLSVFIATVAFPRTSTGIIDRFLVSAEAYNVPSVIVFNKLDLHKNELYDVLQKYTDIYKSAGYTVLHVSATEHTNMDALKKILKNKTSLLSGHSGVGKSHIINALDPSLNIKTGEISSSYHKGKHVTTYAQMHQLGFGAKIIDTPGIKEFGLVDFEQWELGHWFPEFKKYIPFCRYSNCIHLNEPGCAVLEAVKNKSVHSIRYQNYLNILNNIEEEPEIWE